MGNTLSDYEKHYYGSPVTSLLKSFKKNEKHLTREFVRVSGCFTDVPLLRKALRTLEQLKYVKFYKGSFNFNSWEITEEGIKALESLGEYQNLKLK